MNERNERHNATITEVRHTWRSNNCKMAFSDECKFLFAILGLHQKSVISINKNLYKSPTCKIVTLLTCTVARGSVSPTICLRSTYAECPAASSLNRVMNTESAYTTATRAAHRCLHCMIAQVIQVKRRHV